MASNFPTSVVTEYALNLHVRWDIDRNYNLFDSTSTHKLPHLKHWKYSDIFTTDNNVEWQLCLCKNDSNSPLLIGIDPVLYDKDSHSPIMAFSINVISANTVYKTARQDGGDTNKFYLKDNVMWQLIMKDSLAGKTKNAFTGPFTVVVTFRRRKFGKPEELDNKQRRLASLGRMLSDNIYTDVTINTFDGVKFGAHRAVLASSSPVFHSMFSHDLQEKEHSTINITDMSTKACQAFVKYIYGNMEHEELVEHRVELLGAADKYDIPELTIACVESFSRDIDRKNVVEIIRTAIFYRLTKLKNRCMRFLVKLGNVFEIQDEFKELMQNGDTDLVDEIFREVLNEWKSCREGGMDIEISTVHSENLVEKESTVTNLL